MVEYATNTAYREPAQLLREKGPARNQIPERLLARLWRKRAALQEWFRTTGGAKLRVIYPGHIGGGAGPDFRNALIEMEGVGLVRGDVEIHIHQRDWDSHGHAHDRNYNGVVLHAALEVESPATVLQNGQQAPVLSLAPLLEEGDLPNAGSSTGLWSVLASRGYHQPDTPNEMGALLDRVGDQRFLARSAFFQRFLQEQGPDQTLYEGLLEGLVYRFNQQPFLKLAQRAPYAALLQAVAPMPREQRARLLESWLLLLSGFPSIVQGSDRLPPLFGPGLRAEEWHTFRVRPPNHPRRRIAGATALLDRFLEDGLVPGLTQIAAKGSPKELTSALTVVSSAGRKQALIGESRARDLAVNVVLPFCHGLAQGEDTGNQAQEHLDLYRRFGKLQENELTREMADQLLEAAWTGLVSNARRQQGLLHLHSLLSGGSWGPSQDFSQ